MPSAMLSEGGLEPTRELRPARDRAPPPAVHPLAGLALAAAGVGLVTWFAAGSARRGPPRRFHPRSEVATADAAQRLNHASTLLAASVLFDSGLEHYRGQYFNRAMYTPVLVSSAVLASSLHGAGDSGPRSSLVRHAVQALAAFTGLVGLGFHAYNVGKREGGYSWENLFYAAPIGAPFALTLAGALGVAAERVRDADPDRAHLLGVPAGRTLALGTALGLLGTVGEAGLLHFRGAFHNPAMVLPVALPPLAAALMAWAGFSEAEPRPLARFGLWTTAGLGVGGVALHAYGVGRAMGGWRNWSQNVLDGPPLPAPPAFTGLALAGLAALDLLEAGHA
jgi:hypothetical protein